MNTPLEAWLGWRLGLSCSLAIIVLATAIGFACLVRAVEPRRWPVAFLGFPLALSWELYMGFFPFTVGSALGLLVLALAVAWREPARLRPVVLAFLLFLQAICHVFTAALTGLVLAALLVARTPGGWRARAREGLRVALIGAPAAGILLVAVLDRGSQVSTPFAHETLVQPLLMSLAELPRLVAPGPWWRGLLLLLVVGVAVVLGALRLGRKEANATDATFLVAGVTLLAAGALTPLHVPGWQFFSPRFLLLGVFLCLATIPVERLGRPELVVGLAAASLSFSAVWLVASAALHRRLAAACDDAIQGLSAPVVRHSLWLPIELAPQGGLPFDPVASEVPWLMPLRHMPMLYALVEGGLTPYSVAVNAATSPFVIRETGPKAPPIPAVETYAPLVESTRFDADPVFRRGVVDQLATYGMFYEGVLVTGAHAADLAPACARVRRRLGARLGPHRPLRPVPARRDHPARRRRPARGRRRRVAERSSGTRRRRRARARTARATSCSRTPRAARSGSARTGASAGKMAPSPRRSAGTRTLQERSPRR